MRYAANKLYADEIERLFSSNTTRSEAPTLNSTQLSDVAQYVRKSIATHFPNIKFSDTDDLFALGMDSLQTTQLCDALTTAIKPHISTPTQITTSLVYENPTAEKLIKVVQKILTTASKSAHVTAARGKVPQMLELLSKYTSDLPSKSSGTKGPARKLKNVVLTGTTGSLGYYLLVSLVKDSKTGTIYCLNRSGEAKENFWNRYQERDDKVQIPEGKIKFLKVSFGDDMFGLDKATFDEISNNVDIIIHNAWKVSTEEHWLSMGHVLT